MCARDFWISQSALDPKLDGMTRSTLDERRGAVRPLVAPATSWPGEPFPTDKHIM